MDRAAVNINRRAETLGDLAQRYAFAETFARQIAAGFSSTQIRREPRRVDICPDFLRALVGLLISL